MTKKNYIKPKVVYRVFEETIIPIKTHEYESSI